MQNLHCMHRAIGTLSANVPVSTGSVCITSRAPLMGGACRQVSISGKSVILLQTAALLLNFTKFHFFGLPQCLPRA